MSAYRIPIAIAAEVEASRHVMRKSASTLCTGFYTSEEAEDVSTYLTIPDPDIIADDTFYLADEGSDIVGCGGWSSRRKIFTGSSHVSLSFERFDLEKDSAGIRACFVSPRHARRGIATAIHRECEETAALGALGRLN